MLFEVEKISKIEAAERQLRTAIRLFFNSDDSVSIHTLVSAADGILTGLCLKNGSSPGFMRDLKTYIKPGKQKKYLQFLNKAQNFFKHADTDSEEELEFFKEGTRYMIFSSIMAFRNLTKKCFFEGYFYELWFILAYPDTIHETNFAEFILAAQKIGIDPDPEDLELFKEVLDKKHPMEIPDWVYY